MIRKNFFLTEGQIKKLRKTCINNNLPHAEFLRRMLDYVLERPELIDKIMYRRSADED